MVSWMILISIHPEVRIHVYRSLEAFDCEAKGKPVQQFILLQRYQVKKTKPLTAFSPMKTATSPIVLHIDAVQAITHPLYKRERKDQTRR
jgi:hypothetical protein